jgi:DNA-binding GntR family transcriptional regulator
MGVGIVGKGKLSETNEAVEAQLSPAAKKKMGKTVEDVYSDIKNMIYLGFLAPGQKIIYRDLALKLKVSSTPVIQALKRIERSNLVTYAPNKGYFVGELTVATVEELFQAREILEVNSIPLLMKNLNQQKLNEIRNAFKLYSIATEPEKGRGLMLRDAQFHLKIIEFTGNKSVYGFLKDLLEQIYLRWRPEYLQRERVDEALSEHREIFKSLSKGNPELTMRLLKDHIRNGKDHIIHSLQIRDSIIANRMRLDLDNSDLSTLSAGLVNE